MDAKNVHRHSLYGIFGLSRNDRLRRVEPNARKLTRLYSGASGVIAFVSQPIPALDELIVVPIHYRLCTKMAKLHGVDKSKLPWKQIRKIIWYGAAGRLAANLSLGLLPVVGLFANAVTAIALTEFLAHYLDEALAHPEKPPQDVTMASMKTLFEEALRTYAAAREKKHDEKRKQTETDAVASAPSATAAAQSEGGT